MKPTKLLTVAVTTLSLLFSISVRAEAVSGKEYQAVIDTAFNYFNGVANADQSLLEKAFDQNIGHIKSIRKNKETGKAYIDSVSLKTFAGYFKEATKDTWKADILSVDIVDDKMAMVKLSFETSKTHYIDYLVMYKLEDQWRIINKTYVANKKS